MSVIGSNVLAGASGGGAAAGYEITRSLRFDSSSSSYLNRTPSSVGDRTSWTWSGWVKRSSFAIGQEQHVFGAGRSSDNTFEICFNGGDNLKIFCKRNTTTKVNLVTTQVFRDPGAWFHLVVALDTSQATSSDTVKIYINGSQIEDFSTSTYPNSTTLEVNNNSDHAIGHRAYSDNRWFNGYLAEIYFIDGQQLAPTDFGELDDNNVWQPIEYSGTYGTNGFHLDFSDATSTTTIAEDSSGNNNDWTANNFSVASGAGNDSLLDTPTNYDDGTNVGGNFATLNPLSAGTNAVLANGNLDWSTTQTSNFLAQSTIAMPSGKWYCEYTATSANNMVGIQRVAGTVATSFVGGNADSWGYYGGNGNKYNNNINTSYGASYTTNDVVGIALDLDAGTLTFYKNGSSQGQAYSGLTNGPYTFVTGNGANVSGVFNFGQRAFAYTAPSGFKALCTTNLPDPTIADGSTAMDVALYTGNGTSQSITGLGFSPDLVWIKPRSAANDHVLCDTIRGAGARLFSNLTNSESTAATSLTSFNSDGFSIGSHSSINTNSVTHVGWTWDAGTSTVSNTDGSITSSVRANASAGFSIVSYTGNNTTSTVGHGLNATPSLVIVKSRSAASLTGWMTKHSSLSSNYNLALNLTDAAWNPAGNGWVGDLTSSTTFSLVNGSSNGNNVNQSGVTYVAYCFAPVEGYSAFGSYTGNGSSDGPFVYTGFRPAFLITKASSTTGNWHIHDSSRSVDNPAPERLFANLSNAEQSTSAGDIDILSNGFKLRNSTAGYNANNVTHIWIAFAEHPFSLNGGLAR